MEEWVPDQANALEQVGVFTEALDHRARLAKALAEESSGAIGETRQVLQAERDEVQEHIAGVHHAWTYLERIVNGHTTTINAMEVAVNQQTLDLRAVFEMATATKKLAAELRLESNNAYYHIRSSWPRRIIVVRSRRS